MSECTICKNDNLLSNNVWRSNRRELICYACEQKVKEEFRRQDLYAGIPLADNLSLTTLAYLDHLTMLFVSNEVVNIRDSRTASINRNFRESILLTIDEEIRRKVRAPIVVDNWVAKEKPDIRGQNFYKKLYAPDILPENEGPIFKARRRMILK